MELFFLRYCGGLNLTEKQNRGTNNLSERNNLPLSKGLPAMKLLHSCCHIGESTFCTPISRYSESLAPKYILKRISFRTVSLHFPIMPFQDTVLLLTHEPKSLSSLPGTSR